MKTEKRSKGIAILSECCANAFGYVRNGKAMITTKHGNEVHMLILSPEDLRNLANLTEESCANIASDRAA